MSDTIVSTAGVATERGARYGKQLVSFRGRKFVGVWDEASGSGTLDMGNSAAHVTLKSTTDICLSCRAVPITNIAIELQEGDRLRKVLGFAYPNSAPPPPGRSAPNPTTRNDRRETIT